MSECVLDASAVLAFLNKETGADLVRPWLRGGFISAVNAGEVMNCLNRPGRPLEDIVQLVRSVEMRIIDFGFEQAVVASTLEPYAKAANLSFADRACLSLGMMQGVPVLTADREWSSVDLGIDIRLIR
ncbi:MAG: type II toxin-antitoxin system VapC family toxin [Planctomycetaceae bacterium]|nr:type II toxin-antitoxin system VapC family toxin [Planctomycetaceae bacterium]